jgi:hypothetical protein
LSPEEIEEFKRKQLEKYAQSADEHNEVPIYYYNGKDEWI